MRLVTETSVAEGLVRHIKAGEVYDLMIIQRRPGLAITTPGGMYWEDQEQLLLEALEQVRMIIKSEAKRP